MLDICGVSKHFDGVLAVDNLSLQLVNGRLYALIGPNGCGKSSLLNLISGFYRPDRGAIYLNGRRSLRIDGLPTAARASLGIARMFQEPRGIPEFTVLQELTLSMLPVGSDNLLSGGLAAFRLNTGASNPEELLAAGELDPSHLVGELSYGQQRVLDCLCLIARCPALLLLDEPFAGVDPVNLKLLCKLIASQAHQSGAIILLVSHEIPSVMEIANEMVLMDAGRIVVQGVPADVVRAKQFREVYLA